MISNLPIIIIRCLLITIILEVLSALILKIKNKKDLLNIILVNLITNPIFSISIFLINFFYGVKAYYISLIFFELLIVLIEGYMYKKVRLTTKINYFLLSFILNCISYFGGLLIQKVL